jgi:hypothetical protein
MSLLCLCSSEPSVLVGDEEIIPPGSPNTRRPFNMTPLGQVPNELLLTIFDLCITSAKDVARISAVCVYLRSLAVREHRLWSNIDLRRYTTNSIMWAMLCANRAGDGFLSVLATDLMLYDPRFLTSVLPYATELDLEVSEGSYPMFASFSPSEQKPQAPALRSLIMRGHASGSRCQYEPTSIMKHMLRLSSVTLTRLVLYGGTVDEVPSLPELVYLSLQSVCIPSQALHGVLTGSPLLRTVIIQSTILGIRTQENLDFLTNAQGVVLPHLRHLKIVSGEFYSSALLRILPNPSHQLEIIIRPQNSITPAQPRDLTTIIARLKHHWQAQCGGLDALPSGHLSITIADSRVAHVPKAGNLCFGCTAMEGLEEPVCTLEPSLSFSAECFLHSRLSILNTVETFQLNVNHGANITPSMLHNEAYSLRQLVGLRKVVIRLADLQEHSSDVDGIAGIFTDRKLAGLPLVHLELFRCATVWKAFGLRLEASGLILSVTES